jgi:CRP-like cAMP-binding protein
MPCEIGKKPTLETLAGIGIFRELAPDVVASLSRRCRWRRYAAGQTILQYQDEGRDVFFILNGRACAIYYSWSGREVRFSDIPMGELFGEFAALDNQPRAADVIALTDSLVALMSADLFWEVLRRHETVCAAMLRRLTSILRMSQRRVLEFSTLPVRSRLHAGACSNGPRRRSAGRQCRHFAGAQARRTREPDQHAPRGGDARAQRADARKADWKAGECPDYL